MSFRDFKSLVVLLEADQKGYLLRTGLFTVIIYPTLLLMAKL